MKKFFLFFLAVAMGTGIAVTVKANRTVPASSCCDDFGKVCAVVNGVPLLGPVRTATKPCP